MHQGNVYTVSVEEFLENSRRGRHRGVFKHWPEVYKLWFIRQYGWPVARTVDFEQPDWSFPPTGAEMLRFCSRRRV